MAKLSKAYFCLIAGVLTGIIVVSMLRNREINWVVTGTTFILSVLAFFAILLTRLEIQKKRY
ncbi:hypothetical protein [Heyndrickxia oleronia]|uniref:hypothetical protein n=1 Tax=Heyndrickxia oleronia TaxID=38875 RepID=UPI0015D3C334|nr:hypothetical protein [Heyndrickxia oleronia]NYV64099.1 hypothetical protein [Bacillus sp. Gen3]MCI1593149.1 hypothetical protein [Heyndrickxia oleronia]MCI1612475.1 hypothetical protein [Heyndrickxia oleronia]MCI1743703.1 hypothetical protein [Heyndrickxia oleronia]MCI1760410.1 hypothetical protein [Heyndrickxia oleronia]